MHRLSVSGGLNPKHKYEINENNLMGSSTNIMLDEQIDYSFYNNKHFLLYAIFLPLYTYCALWKLSLCAPKRFSSVSKNKHSMNPWI